jgi:hypothetical protein
VLRSVGRSDAIAIIGGLSAWWNKGYPMVFN